MLSERISTWRPIRSGRKNWQARQTVRISKQLMWKPLSVFDQWPKVGLPFAQRPPTCVGGVCHDNFPGVDQPHGHALLHPPWVLSGGQGCYTGLIHPDMQDQEDAGGAGSNAILSRGPWRFSRGWHLAERERPRGC